MKDINKNLELSMNQVISSSIILIEEVKLLIRDSKDTRKSKVFFDAITSLQTAHDFLVENKASILESMKIFDMMKNAKGEIYTKEYLITGDYTTLKISLLKNSFSKKPTDTLISEKKIFYSKRYWKFDISTGFFYTTLVNPDYYIDANKAVQKEKNPKFDISAGALAHIKYVASQYVKYSACGGAAMSPIDAKGRYFLGAG